LDTLKELRAQLDQKSRELEIEAALERVRVRTMTMQSSEELAETAAVMFQQLNKLGLSPERMNIGLVQADEGIIEFWLTDQEGKQINHFFTGRIDEPTTLSKVYSAWKRRRRSLVIELQGEELNGWLQYIREELGIPFRSDLVSGQRFHSIAFFNHGLIGVSAPTSLPKIQLNLLERFAKVFEQTYTRFLDLKKAEAQAREAQIEAGLERLRAQTMTMHHSDRLFEAASVLFHEVQALGISPFSCGFAFFDSKEPVAETWISPMGTADFQKLIQRFDIDPHLQSVYDTWKQGVDFFELDLSGNELAQHFRNIGNYFQESGVEYLSDISSFLAEVGVDKLERMIAQHVYFSHGMLMFSFPNPNEETNILKRFAKVFEQTYTRFLDLQKAETQAREAQIEAALERVRARTMAMHKSEELAETASLLYNELSQLGVKDFLNCGFVEVDEANNVQHGWMTMPDGTISEGFHLPLKGDSVLNDRFKGWKDQEPCYHQEVGGKKLKDHMDFVFPTMGSKEVEDMTRQNFPDPTIFYCASFKQGYLHLITDSELPEEHESLLVRFTGVFQQTYTRFLDLQKAEAQAREARIEAALERVRARSMAMHKSDELGEVVAVLYDQMNALDFAALGCELILCDEKKELLEYWTASPEQAQLPKNYPIPRTIHPFFQQAWNAWEKRTPRLVITLKGADKRAFDKLIFEKTAFKNLPQAVKDFIQAGKIDVFSLVSMKYGLLEAVDTTPLPEEKFFVLERFAKVFEQTYTRFLDLQKAEAQAREAQIEAALERVRAKASAMHRSDELKKVASELRHQMGLLGQRDLEVCGIHLYDEHEELFESWVALRHMKSNKIMESQTMFPKNGLRIFDEMFRHYRSKKNDYVIINEGENAREFFDMLKKHAPDIYKAQASFVKKVPFDQMKFYWAFSDFTGGSLLMITLIPPQEESLHLLRRAANVFDLAFRRFKDLKQAEAQAREAEIEVALERVRSASMAMHQSEELPNVALTMLDEIELLGVPLFGAGVSIVNDDNNTHRLYFADNSAKAGKKTLLITGDIPLNAFWLTRENVKLHDQGHTENSFQLKGKKLTAWIEWVRKYMSKERADRLQAADLNKVYVYNIAFYGRSVITISSLMQFSEEHWSILRRMSKTFAMSYSRFLDLQKVEEQAREAQIEVALERVRAASMAMHKSEELPNVALTMLNEIESLAVPLFGAGVSIPNEEKNTYKLYFADNSEAGDMKTLLITQEISMDAWWLTRELNVLLDQGQAEMTFEMKGRKLTAWMEWVGKYLSKEREARLRQANLSNVFAYFIRFYGRSMITISSLQQLSEEHWSILRRMSRTFAMSYSRFLDLQKAETQAREAQIEAALERVRARTMGMHHSEELLDTAQILFQQLKELGVELHVCGFSILDRDSLVGKQYLSIDGNLFPEPLQIQLDVDPYLMGPYEDWKAGKTKLILDIQGNALKEHLTVQLNQFKSLGSVDILANQASKYSKSGEQLQPRLVVHHAFFKYGYLFLTYDQPIEDMEILVRFANVFEQTYTRFLDLQKAEAQAREAEIQLALERIRARTMAMHKSDELTETASLIFKQLELLGIKPWTFGFNIWIDDEPIVDAWSCSAPSYIMWKMQVPHAHDPTLIEIYQHSTEDIPLFKTRIEGEALQRHIEYMLNLIGTDVAKEITRGNVQIPTAFNVHAAYFKFGYLLTVTDTPVAEAGTLFPRFANVFEQTYTRFLDLKKAESQAREAQIETALERVRAASMAMYESAELPGVALELVNQLDGLGIKQLGSSIMIEDEATGKFDQYSAHDKLHEKGKFINLFKGYELRLLAGGRKILKQLKQGQKDFTIAVKGKELQEWMNFTRDNVHKGRGEAMLKAGFKCIYFHFAVFHGVSQIVITTLEPLPNQDRTLLRRMADTFALSYRRYLDLQKAEAQAREAEIELALERVRAKTMAMQKSEELRELVFEYYKQIHPFGFAKWGFEIKIAKEDKSGFYCWISPPGARVQPEGFNIPTLNHWVLKKYWSAYEQQIPITTIVNSGADKRKLAVLLLEKSDMKNLPEDVKTNIMDTEYVHFTVAAMRFGLLKAVDMEQVPQKDYSILQRFAKVFEQTYTRFLDLQKAEAQAREAQIEAALERIRSRSMAMHKSDELQEVINRLFLEIQGLGVQMGSSYLVTEVDKDIKKGVHIWVQNNVNLYAERVHLAYLDHPLFHNFYKAWWDKTLFYTEIFNKKEKDRLFNHLFKNSQQLSSIPDERKKYVLDGSGFSRSVVIYNNVAFIIQKYDDIPFHPDEISIQKRFGSVFEQTYTRFLDLQKAEAQAREAQIEAALERVRASTMAMHHSDDLLDAAALMFQQLQELGGNLFACGFVLVDKDKPDSELWMSAEGKFQPPITIPNDKEPVTGNMFMAWKKGTKLFVEEAGGEALVAHYNCLLSIPKTGDVFQGMLDAGISFPTWQRWHGAFFTYGYLLIITTEPFEDTNLFVRFAKVFDQTYTRFLDLRKAEEQAREAQIEAALERIRSKALAMQSSADLHGVSIVLRDQMGLLGQPDLESSIVHLYNKPDSLESWYTFRSTETDSDKIVTDVAIIPANSCEYIKETLEKYHSGETDYTIVSNGKKLIEWYNVMVKVAPDTIEYDKKGKMIVPKILYYHHSKFSGGALLMISNKKPTEEAKELQRRAAKVFNLAYQRFLDLQQAELRAKESEEQASLDRVRGEIASMRSKDDLNRITPVIWRELKALEVPFFRCGVFIVDDEAKKVDTYLSNPEGESLAAWRSDYDTLPLFNASVKAWKKQHVYRTEWNKQQFIEFAQILQNQGLVRDVKRYQAGKDAPDYLALQMIPFKQGMLYVGSAEKLDDDQIELVQALASAFSIAYSRYEDFRKLEKAKSEIEQTLSELRSTQTQLIHSEKMASLGELTAGIAHEIQNPLNFVNNFSEVSKELIFELKAEREKLKVKRDESLEEELLDDVIQNLEKITHHGKRASDIVKGMLQHSRASSGEKELTNINALADEYLRLAYHGLRAKDKSFNADFKLELDENLPKVSVKGQEIGRVLLNLINNAFYAVSEKSRKLSKHHVEIGDKLKEGQFVPTVMVKTKKIDKLIEIRVGDNGDGIPPQVIDKIFQPFFTTKPTGQGTGLGLSLSYDIITKGHNGNLEVDSVEGLGTEFIIQLPVV